MLIVECKYSKIRPGSGQCKKRSSPGSPETFNGQLDDLVIRVIVFHEPEQDICVDKVRCHSAAVPIKAFTRVKLAVGNDGSRCDPSVTAEKRIQFLQAFLRVWSVALWAVPAAQEVLHTRFYG
jgi:hypothetical protein